jgi:hypothetical protein
MKSEYIEKAIIFYIYQPSLLTGSLINAFEYFLQAFEQNKDLKLVFIDAEKKDYKEFIRIIKNRYIIDSKIEKFEKNFMTIMWPELNNFSFGTSLILDFGTMYKVKDKLNSKQIIVISEKYTDDQRFFIDHSNITYYGEMPFQYKDIDYKMKILFSRYKPLRFAKEGIYVNSPSNEDFTFLKDLELPNKPILFKQRQHVENFFEHFDTYLYWHAGKWFDPTPRLFLECAFYKKKILYFNPYDVEDGSYYRINDLKENGLKNRFLNMNDEIISQLI